MGVFDVFRVYAVDLSTYFNTGAIISLLSPLVLFIFLGLVAM